MRELVDKIKRRSDKAGLTCGVELLAQLQTYLALLAQWNQRINLTAFDLEQPTDEAVDRLIIEPVLAARHLPVAVETVLDAGSGGGSPAIPLRLASSPFALWMVEAKTRKSVFLREACRALDIKDVTVETARFEQLLTKPSLHEAFDVVTIRAVRVDTRTLTTLQAFLRPGGHMLLFQGADFDDAALRREPTLRQVAAHSLVPTLRSQLVVLTKDRLGVRS
jgi:16S rRNA (guanine527-N7)-methyltransferase